MSSEASDETAFPRASWWVGVMEVRGGVQGWEALGKAVSAGAEPRRVAELLESLNLVTLAAVAFLRPL